jgi:hypothetical protein
LPTLYYYYTTNAHKNYFPSRLNLIADVERPTWPGGSELLCRLPSIIIPSFWLEELLLASLQI